jgi:hypothetical protein
MKSVRSSIERPAYRSQAGVDPEQELSGCRSQWTKAQRNCRHRPISRTGAPSSRWAFRNVRKLIPIADIDSAGDASPFDARPVPLDQFRLTSAKGASLTLEAVLRATATDGFVILHDGAHAACSISMRRSRTLSRRLPGRPIGVRRSGICLTRAPVSYRRQAVARLNGGNKLICYRPGRDPDRPAYVLCQSDGAPITRTVVRANMCRPTAICSDGSSNAPPARPLRHW